MVNGGYTFHGHHPEAGQSPRRHPEKGGKKNPKYEAAFNEFVVTCLGSLNSNLAEADVDTSLPSASYAR